MAEINHPVEGEKPVLALDIDGVFSVLTRTPPKGFVLHPRPGNVSEYYNPAHGKWIKEFLPSFEAVYMTSHRSHSHEDIGRLLGLPELDWVNFFGFNEPNDESLNRERRPALERLFIDRPLVWIDDDLEEIDFAWASQRTEAGTETFVIKTHFETGLERAHIDEIHQWYGNLATSRLEEN